MLYVWRKSSVGEKDGGRREALGMSLLYFLLGAAVAGTVVYVYAPRSKYAYSVTLKKRKRKSSRS